MSHVQEEMLVEFEGDLLAQESERDGKWDELPQEILNMIFNQLAVPDLLSLSVVSRNWQKIARDILKKSRECYVYIKNFSQDIQAVNDMIASTNLMEMANGLHIHLPTPTEDNDRSFEEDDEPFGRGIGGRYSSLDENIRQCEKTTRKLKEAKGKLPHLLSTPWSYVTLRTPDPDFWEGMLSTIDALILGELISSTNQSLKKLVVGEDLDCYFLVGCGRTFPKLKVLQVQREELDRHWNTFIEKFLSTCAPNLEEVTGAMWSVQEPSECEINPFVMVRIKNLDFSYCYNGGKDIPASFSSLSGLHRLKLGRWSGDPIAQGIQFSIVLGSLETLEELQMENSVFYDLCTGLEGKVEFRNLRRLGLTTGRNVPLGREMAVWKELWKLCPNLEQLQLCRNHIAANEDEEEEEEGEEIPAVPSLNGGDQCHLPLEIQLDWREGQYYEEDLEFLSKVYRNCHKLEIMGWYARHNNAFNISSIFLHFHSLQYLEFSKCSSTQLGNIDRLLCGINIEEAELLLTGPEIREDATSMDPPFVPVRPSIWNAKNLLEVKITGQVGYGEARVNQSWLIQVGHLRHLKVTYEGGVPMSRQFDGLPACTTLLRAQPRRM